MKIQSCGPLAYATPTLITEALRPVGRVHWATFNDCYEDCHSELTDASHSASLLY